MKRTVLILLLMAGLSMQTVVMAKGQWIYSYSHPTASEQVETIC